MNDRKKEFMDSRRHKRKKLDIPPKKTELEKKNKPVKKLTRLKENSQILLKHHGEKNGSNQI